MKNSYKSSDLFAENVPTPEEQTQILENEAYQNELREKMRKKWDSMTAEEKSFQEESEHFQDIIDAFHHYGAHTFQTFKKKEVDFKNLIPRYQQLLPQFMPRMERIRGRIGENQHFIRLITKSSGMFLNGEGKNVVRRRPGPTPTQHNMDKVRSTLRQCARDWGSDGKAERALCYAPILEALAKLYPDFEKREGVKILNPGCGLGRLTWEIAKLGFSCQGNEFSYFMLLASNCILNCSFKEKHEIFPFIHEVTNVKKIEDQLRPVRIPDVDPMELPAQAKFSMSAGDFVEVYGNDEAKWDCVASCFFLDTAHNILLYLEVISRMLKPGGYMINIGPLLYHYQDMYKELSIEISYEELRQSFEYFGLKIITEKFDLPATYTNNPHSMLAMQYKCVFLVCQRVANAPVDQVERMPFSEAVRQGHCRPEAVKEYC